MNWQLERQSLWRRLLIGLLFVVVASGLRALVFGSLGSGVPYLIYFPTVTLAALFGGLASGVLATIGSGLMVYFWVQQGTLSSIEWLGMAVFAGSGVLVSAIADSMKRAHDRTRQAEQQANLANDDLRGQIRDREIAEASLKESENHYRMLFASSPLGVSLQEVVSDAQGRACDFRLLSVNPAFERMMRVPASELLDRTMREVMPQLDPATIEQCCQVGLGRVEEQSIPFGAVHNREYVASLHSPQRGRFVMQLVDVTEDAQAKAALAERAEELQRWHRATSGREGRVLGLKAEVNVLLARLGEPPRYYSAVEGGDAASPAGWHGGFAPPQP